MTKTTEIVYTKEMLLNAFQKNKRKRNFMLYKVYESWFSYDLTAETIATLITKDLGFPISKSIVDMTRLRVMNKLTTLPEDTSISIGSTSAEMSLKNTDFSEIFVPPAEPKLKDVSEKIKFWDFESKPLPKTAKTLENPSVKPRNILEF